MPDSAPPLSRAFGPDSKIAIIGAGFSGVALAKRLKQAGFENFTIYEASDGFGGTWRVNTYPGVASDVPARLYCLPDELNPNWSEAFPPGAEICRYIEGIAERRGLYAHLRANTRIVAADHDGEKWTLTDAAGMKYHADLMVGAIGPFQDPLYPNIPGIETFTGAKIHSAKWDHSVPLKGRRVGIIGSASSAAQIISELVDQVGHLTVFARTPNFVVRRKNRPIGPAARALMRAIPGLQRLVWWRHFVAWEARHSYMRKDSFLNRLATRSSKRFIRDNIKDPKLADRLTPDFPAGCKRFVVSSKYLPALQAPQTTLVTDSIASVSSNAVIDASGAHHEIDVLVMATGYQAFDITNIMKITGPNGLDLADFWRDKMITHRTMGVPGFPNFFLMLGPNTGLGHNSMTVIIDSQAEYIMSCIQQMRERRVSSITPNLKPSAELYDYIQKSIGESVLSSNCQAWYKDETGRVHTIWPNSYLEYRRMLRRPVFEEFEAVPSQLASVQG